MGYTEYKNRIDRVGEMLKKLWRFRVPVCAALVLLIAFAITMASVAGTVSDAAECPAEIVYGEELPYRAKAVFQGVRYEYRRDGEEEWMEQLPAATGGFWVRAVSEGAGKKGKEHFFTVLPRELRVGVEKEWTYGELPVATADPLEGDELVCTEFSYTFGKNTFITPKAESIRVMQGEEDVTSCYRVIAEETEVTVTRREITVEVDYAEKVYDGTPLTSDKYIIEEGSLAFGDELFLTFSESLTDVGRVENRPEYSVFGEQGDMTDYYRVRIKSGALTVKKRPLSVSVAGAEKEYDGLPLTADVESAEVSGLAEGHSLLLSGENELRYTGRKQIELKVTVTDGEGRDVTENYDISLSAGELAVTPRPVVLVTGSEEFFYDGLPHVCREFSLRYAGETAGAEALAAGETARLAVDFSVTDVIRKNGAIAGISNVLVIRIFSDEGGRASDVTSEYLITAEYGTLTVLPCPITVACRDREFIYDGERHSADPREDIFVAEGELAHGQRVEGTVAASVQNVWEGAVTGRFFARIFDENDQDVSDNYEIELRFGTLSILPRPIRIVTGSRDFLYDGGEHFYEEFEYAADSPYELVAGHFLRAKEGGVRTGAKEVRKYENRFTPEIFDRSGNVVTENYEVLIVRYGVLTVRYRLVITLYELSKVYDGAPLSYHSNDWFIEKWNNLGDLSVSFSLSGSLTKVGTYPMETIRSLPISVSKDGLSLTEDDYVLSFAGEPLKIIPRHIEITSESVTKKDDGTELSAQSCRISLGSLANGDAISVSIEGVQKGVGVSPNTIGSVSIRNVRGEDVTFCYEIVRIEGRLEITG